VRHLHASRRPQAQAEDDALHDRPAGDLLDPAHRARETHDPQTTPVKRPDAKIAPGVMARPWVMAAVPMGLHGLDRDRGVLK